MSDTPTEAQIAALAAAVPGLENTLLDAIARAMQPDLKPVQMCGFLQIVVGLARTIGQYRKVAGMPLALPEDLWLLMSEAQIHAQAKLYDPSLNAPQAMRLCRLIHGMSRTLLAAIPPPAKKIKPGPNPFTRAKAPPRLPNPDSLDLSMRLEPATIAALRGAVTEGDNAAELNRVPGALRG